MRNGISLFICIVLFSPYLSSANTYYVAPSGLAQGDGTEEKPWSVDVALSKGGGNTYIFLPGNYHGPLVLGKYHAGTATTPTVLKSKTKWRAQITGMNADNLIRITSDSPYVFINGFEIWGAGYSGILSKSDHTTIMNCWIHNNGTMGIRIDKKKNIVIENNLIEYNGMHPHFHHGIYVDGQDHVIRGNIVRHNSGFGMHLYPNIQKSVIENNLIYGHPNHAGIILTTTEKGEGLKVVNNTLAYNKVGVEVWGSTGTLIQNNIFAGNQKVFSFSKVKDPQIDHNLYEQESEVRGPHDIVGNPQFLNVVRGIYWLGEKSAARGRANPEGAPEKDLWGNPRPKDNPPDMGAYQFIPLRDSDKILNRWQYGSRFNTPESGEIPDLWQAPQ